MNDLEPDRRAELIAAALAGELTPDEGAELDALRADDPTIDAEFAELSAVAHALPAVERWDDVAPSASLAARIAALDDGGMADAPVTPIRSSRRLMRPLLLAVGAAACVGLGLGGGLLLAAPPAAVEGPPGTLGAVEEVAFEGAPESVEIDAALVAHTWGTETVLTVEGLDAGDAFTVVVVGEDGEEVESGTFLGSTVPIECRLNAAVLREDVAAVAIRAIDGGQIAVAEVPAV
ncbi:hypothetical protein [Arenivirga flava]|uniref:Anti-sigma factor n=1 Tax=Arenivirga flava TaxID=1930060 RepID=A0AA37UVU6_9MICO|nr:hypothetical protein [Arenivirga flava]GMA29632.1 hypothetical protein GCM10025874_28850 [Arenivirga flava]